jgi:hypothetical protein
MAHHSNQSQLSEDDKNLLAAAAAVEMGIVAVALFPNPMTTPVMSGKCGYYLGESWAGRTNIFRHPHKGKRTPNKLQQL